MSMSLDTLVVVATGTLGYLGLSLIIGSRIGRTIHRAGRDGPDETQAKQPAPADVVTREPPSGERPALWKAGRSSRAPSRDASCLIRSAERD